MTSPSCKSHIIGNINTRKQIKLCFSPTVKEEAKEKHQEKSKQQGTPTGEKQAAEEAHWPQTPLPFQGSSCVLSDSAPAAVSTEPAAEPIASAPSGPAMASAAACVGACVDPAAGPLSAGPDSALAICSVAVSAERGATMPSAGPDCELAISSKAISMSGCPKDALVLGSATACVDHAARPTSADPTHCAMGQLSGAPRSAGLEEASSMWDDFWEASFDDHTQDNAEASFDDLLEGIFDHVRVMEDESLDDREASADADPEIEIEIAASSSDMGHDMAEVACTAVLFLVYIHIFGDL